jgi:type II secretory pathway component PulL
MARVPEQRYESAAAMKKDIDAPSEVKVTGRAERLLSPMPWESRWRRWRPVVLTILIPLIVVLVFAWIAFHVKR